MAILLFILVILLGAFAAIRLLAPDMYLRLNIPKFNLPWGRHRLLPDSAAYQPDQASIIDRLPVAIDTPMEPEEMPMALTEKLKKMEALLLEKNKLIDRLQRNLEAERSHRCEFEKVKSIMDEEIARLKEQIKSRPQKENAHV